MKGPWKKGASGDIGSKIKIETDFSENARISTFINNRELKLCLDFFVLILRSVWQLVAPKKRLMSTITVY